MDIECFEIRTSYKRCLHMPKGTLIRHTNTLKNATWQQEILHQDCHAKQCNHNSTLERIGQKYFL
jgi:hypothetical protein